MDAINRLIERYAPLLTELEPMSEERTQQLRAAWPGAPHDYVEFLRQAGWGPLGDSDYMLYDGLIDCEEIYPGTQGYLLFGDDFTGYGAGFDSTWRVVELDPQGELVRMDELFIKFIESRLADLLLTHR